MRRYNWFCIGLVIFLAFAVAGCGTVPKKYKAEVSGIKSRVETLESKIEGVEARQADVERMTGEQGQAIGDLMNKTERKTARTNIDIKPKAGRSKERTKLIQTCLKNAGYYGGKIDGIKGKQTKRAIKDFQKANGLRADGVVGPKTWELLGRHASIQPASGAEEGAAK